MLIFLLLFCWSSHHEASTQMGYMNNCLLALILSKFHDSNRFNSNFHRFFSKCEHISLCLITWITRFGDCDVLKLSLLCSIATEKFLVPARYQLVPCRYRILTWLKGPIIHIIIKIEFTHLSLILRISTSSVLFSSCFEDRDFKCSFDFFII